MDLAPAYTVHWVYLYLNEEKKRKKSSSKKSFRSGCTGKGKRLRRHQVGVAAKLGGAYSVFVAWQKACKFHSTARGNLRWALRGYAYMHRTSLEEREMEQQNHHHGNSESELAIDRQLQTVVVMNLFEEQPPYLNSFFRFQLGSNTFDGMYVSTHVCMI